MGFFDGLLVLGAEVAANALVDALAGNATSKSEPERTESDNPYVNIIRKAFKKGDLSLCKSKDDTVFKDLDYSGREKDVVHDLSITRLNRRAVSFHASFLTDCIFIRGSKGWEKYAYADLSQIILRGNQAGTVSLIFCDNTKKEVFCKTFHKYLVDLDSDEAYLVDTNLSVLEEFADLLNKLITQSKGQQVKTKYEIEVEDEVFFTAFIDMDMTSNSNKLIYDEKECEKERQNWDTLLNKRNEILLRGASVKYLEYTDDEKKKFPEWCFSNAEQCYAVNNGIMIISKSKEGGYDGFIGIEKNDYCYFPESYSNTKKYAGCKVTRYFGGTGFFPSCVTLYLISGDVTINSSIYYLGNYKSLIRFYQKAFPEKKFNPIQELTFVNFMNFLGNKEISENFLNLKNKMRDAKKTFEMEVEKRHVEQLRKEEEQKILEEKRKEQAKIDALNDF